MASYTQSVLEEQLKAGSDVSAGWPWRLLLLSGAVFLTSVGIYLGMELGFNPYLSSQDKKADQELSQLSNAISEEQAQNFSAFYSQINNIQSLMDDHNKSSQFAAFLEKNTLRNIFFKNLNFDAKEGTIKLDGVAPSYDFLAQQMEIFRKAPEISKVNIEGASLGEEKGSGVNFSIRLILK